MDLSIIILNWNTKDFLRNCLRSLEECAISYKKEIIVVDNASTDDSVAMVKKNFPSVKIIQNKENTGFAKGNNIGIKQSSGRYVCIVNSDVTIRRECFNQLIQHMDTHPTIGIIGPTIFWPDLTVQGTCRKFPGLWNNFCEHFYLNRLFPKYSFFSGEHMFPSFDHKTTKNVDCLVGCFLMIRKKTLEDVGLFDEQFFIYSEEIDLCKRFWKKGWVVKFFPTDGAIHHGRASSSKDPQRFSMEQQISVLKYWKKHRNRFDVAVFLLMLVVSHGLRLAFGSFLYFISPSRREKTVQQISKHQACLKFILFAR